MADWRYLLLLYTFGPLLYILAAWAALGESGLRESYSNIIKVWPIYLVLGLALYVVAWKLWTSPRSRTLVVRRVRYR